MSRQNSTKRGREQVVAREGQARTPKWLWGSCVGLALISIVLCGYGYAAFESDLYVRGTATVRQRNAVWVKQAALASSTGGSVERYVPKIADDATGLYLRMPAGATATYNVTIVNETNNLQVIKSLTPQLPVSGATYQIDSGEDPYAYIAARTTKTVPVKITNTSGAAQDLALLLQYNFIVDNVTAPAIKVSTTKWSKSAVSVTLGTAGTATTGVKNYEYKIVTDNDTANPTSGTTTNKLSVSKIGTNKVQYRTVSQYGIKSAWSNTVTALFDNTKPTVTMVAGGNYWFNDEKEFVTGATYGPSGGSTSCTFGSTTVAKIIQLGVIGAAKVTCKATSNSGMVSADVSTNYTIYGRFYGNGLPCYDGGSGTCPKSGNSVIVPAGWLQFGPYRPISGGCYQVFYYGSGFSGQTPVSSHYNGGNTPATVNNINISSTMVAFDVMIPSAGVGNIEFLMRNNTGANIRIDRIDVAPSPAGCR